MSQKKISDLPPVPSINNTALFEIEQGGVSYKVDFGTIEGTGIDSLNSDVTSAQDLLGQTNKILIAHDLVGNHTFTIGTDIVTLNDTQTLTGKTITAAANTLVIASTDLSDSASIARDTNNLSFFAATTSLQLLGVISDETGTGLLVFNDSPTLLTPTIASFVNAIHSHLNAAGGGTITKAAISDTPWAKGDIPSSTVYEDEANAWGEFRQTFNPNATISGLNVGAHTADPSTLVNGDIWYNSTTNKFRARENGASVDMIGAAGATALNDLTDVTITTRAANEVLVVNAANTLWINTLLTNAHISGTAAIAFSKMVALTINRAVVSDGSGFLVVSAVTNTELGFVGGVTSAIQTQLDAKASTSHQATHQSGGGDALTGLLDATARTSVSKNSAADVGARRTLNFIEGSNVTLTIVDDAAGEEVDITIAATGAGGPEFADNVFRVTGSVDATKKLAFEVDGITTATTRIITVLNEDLTIVGLTNAQTLTNKTLTTPTIGDFTNATHDHSNAAGGGQLDSTLALSDTANIAYLNTANIFGDFDQTFKDNRLLIESPDGLTPVTIINSQQTLARNLTIPVLTGNDIFVTETFAQILSNKTLTEPIFVNNGFLKDVNGNEIVSFGVVASAVNNLKLINAATGLPAELQAVGGDTNIDILMTPKGVGVARGYRESYGFALSDEDTVLTIGVKITTIIVPYDFNIDDVMISVKTAGTGAALVTVDIQREISENSNTFETIFTTKPTIDATEFTSKTAATQPVINSAVDDVLKGERIQLKIDVVDTGNVATGLKVIIAGHALAR